MDEARLKAHADTFYYQQALGPRSEYYLALFAKFEQAGERWMATWNWPAFFFSSAWFAYRRMNGYSLLNFFLPVLFLVLFIVLNQSGLQFVLVAGYLIFAFVVIPMYANAIYYRDIKYRITAVAASTDAEKTGGLLRPPSVRSAFNAILTAVFILGLPLLILVAIPWYADYTPRAKVAESISLTVSLKNTIAEFHHKHQRFPVPHEAEKFRIDGGKYARAIVYDAEKRIIVVTMGEPHKDKRFAIHAEEKDGILYWTCRSIDLDRKYLPSSCRD